MSRRKRKKWRGASQSHWGGRHYRWVWDPDYDNGPDEVRGAYKYIATGHKDELAEETGLTADRDFATMSTDEKTAGRPVYPAFWQEFQKPKVVLSHEVHAKLMFYVRAVKTEISGLGRVIKTGDNAYRVVDIFLLDQSASGGGTTLNDDAVSDFYCDLVQHGKDPSEYYFWWHSHANFSVFWSSIDEANCLRHSQGNSLLSLVVNQSGEMLARFDESGEKSDNLQIIVEPFVNMALRQQCETEAREKVKPWQMWGTRDQWNYNRETDWESEGPAAEAEAQENPDSTFPDNRDLLTQEL